MDELKDFGDWLDDVDNAQWAELDTYLAENRARFDALQTRDGFPDEETGIPGHCRQCHDAVFSIEAYMNSPSCGHGVGCPEC